jgi:hypothetical protein
MFADMFDAMDERTLPRETFYDGYVVNAIIDAAYASMANKQWHPIDLPLWRDVQRASDSSTIPDYDSDHVLIKEERMPDGSTKLILRHKESGRIVQRSR